jgi:hypothetical protein
VTRPNGHVGINNLREDNWKKMVKRMAVMGKLRRRMELGLRTEYPSPGTQHHRQKGDQGLIRVHVKSPLVGH